MPKAHPQTEDSFVTDSTDVKAVVVPFDLWIKVSLDGLQGLCFAQRLGEVVAPMFDDLCHLRDAALANVDGHGWIRSYQMLFQGGKSIHGILSFIVVGGFPRPLCSFARQQGRDADSSALG